MAQALGYVTKLDDGNFTGKLAMGVNTRIDIVANDNKQSDKQPDFRVYSADGGEIGGGWTRRGKTSGKDYVSLTLAHPMIGPRINTQIKVMKGPLRRFIYQRKSNLFPMTIRNQRIVLIIL